MDRRMFLASSVSTGMIAAGGLTSTLQAAPAEFEAAGMAKADLPTPALVLDLDAFEANIKRMADHCRQARCGYRPHAKTHKCPEIARRQMAAGALGISVATVPEAQAMAEAGITGLLLTSPIVDRGKIGRVVELVKAGADIMLAIGHPREVELLAGAAEAAGVTLKVLVDLDVGSRRTGIVPGQPAVELARLIERSKVLRLQGLQAYAGHAAHVVGFEARSRTSREAMKPAIDTRALFKQAGLGSQVLSGGSTGTYNIDPAYDGVTELQVGSYVFMDVDYRRIGGSDGAAVYTDFRPSLTVLTTVVSTTHPDRVSVDAGTKALDTTTTNRPEAKDRPGLQYAPHGDEFGAVTSPSGTTLPKIGERLEFIVPHCDPSVNLYGRIYACRGEKVEAVWPVVARRE